MGLLVAKRLHHTAPCRSIETVNGKLGKAG
jgi:hypothetical protein